jgi:hypothetical protein
MVMVEVMVVTLLLHREHLHHHLLHKPLLP